MTLKDNIEAVSTLPVNAWHWHDLIWSGQDGIEHILNIELALFNEIFIYTRGLKWTEELDPYFRTVINKVNPSFGETDSKELRDKQYKIIMDVYVRHYAAIHQNKDLKLYYYMFLQTTGIVSSLKTEYVLRLFGINPKNTRVHNAKYKPAVLQKMYNDFIGFWSNIEYTSLPSRESQKGLNITEVKQNDEILVVTIIGFQELRGFMSYEEFTKERE